MRTSRTDGAEVLERVRRMRERLEVQLEKNGIDKPSLSEYLKLLQIEREMEEETPKDITVRWVDEHESD